MPRSVINVLALGNAPALAQERKRQGLFKGSLRDPETGILRYPEEFSMRHLKGLERDQLPGKGLLVIAPEHIANVPELGPELPGINRLL
jgi:hypothetical protein